MRWARPSLLCLLVLLGGCEALYVREKPPPKPERARPQSQPRVKLQGPEGTFRVARVHSGDLIELADGRKVRYAGVIAPAQGERYFDESRNANREVVEGRRVLLRYEQRQLTMTGELLAYVLVAVDQFPGQAQSEGSYVIANSQMIRSGSARASNATRHYFRGRFLREMMEAQQNKLGIWQD